MICGGNELYKMYRQKSGNVDSRKEDEETLCTSTECVHLNWSEALSYYSTLNLKEEADRSRFRSFVQDRCAALLADYVHILDRHSSDSMEGGKESASPPPQQYNAMRRNHPPFGRR